MAAIGGFPGQDHTHELNVYLAAQKQPVEPSPDPFLSKVISAHQRQEDLLEALRSSGWRTAFTRYPGSVTLGHPDNDIEIPTPDYVPAAWWPGKTYTSLRQITIMYGPDPKHLAEMNGRLPIKISKVFYRDAHAPWVGARDTTVTLKRAIEVAGERHPARTAVGS